MKKQNHILRIFTCLGFGGIAMVGVMCLGIGFSIHSTVGKYAVYTAFFLQLLSLLVNKLWERYGSRGKQRHTASPKMRRFRLLSKLLWASGALLLIASLVLILLGLNKVNAWVRWLCNLGIILAPLGWIGMLMSYYRQRQAILVLNHREASPKT